jgi:hypothetical protein
MDGQQHKSTDSLSNLVQGAMEDIEKRIGQQLDRMRGEFKENLKNAGGAAGSLLAESGAGVAAGFLGTLAVVHLLHDLTRLPLSVCYGAVAGCLGLTAAGLVGTGIKEVSKVDLIPSQPVRRVKEALTGVS